MTRLDNRARSVMVLGLLIVGLLGASAGNASAMAHYQIWYFDDNFLSFEYGDVSIGNHKYTPPAWACSIKFYSPNYYYWRDEYGNSNGYDDFEHDVVVKLPRPGCPQDEIVILDGAKEIEYETGSSYFEISTNSGFNWLDASGSNHACGFGCVTPPVGFKYLKFSYTLDALIQTIDGLQQKLLSPARRTQVPAALVALTDQLFFVQNEVEQQIALRRRYALGDREATVRAAEDLALAKLGDAARRIGDCEGYAYLAQMHAGFTAAELASDSLAAARSLLQAAESSFPPRLQ